MEITLAVDNRHGLWTAPEAPAAEQYDSPRTPLGTGCPKPETKPLTSNNLAYTGTRKAPTHPGGRPRSSLPGPLWPGG
ncbi:hypothetical protein GCM10009754_23030 [Amycolatopsis minnesotensis]|uniref:Uncharacterized protein n=1 Tax=Amycolatopsis minnesotensis TaxID=337894 RepID=A0ABN2QL85_9PSEU